MHLEDQRMPNISEDQLKSGSFLTSKGFGECYKYFPQSIPSSGEKPDKGNISVECRNAFFCCTESLLLARGDILASD